MIKISLVQEPIAIDQWCELLADVDTGAQGWFSGVTRRKTKTASGDWQITQTLHYEAHRTMAEAELQRLAESAHDEFDLRGVVIVHRLGEVPLGQASVLIGCSSAHRKNVFAALPWIMDRLKLDVPIWKRETYQDDSTEWIHP